MVFGRLFKRVGKRTRERVVRDLMAALNARDHEAVAGHLTEGFVLMDVGGPTIEGRDTFIERDKHFRDTFDNPQIRLDTLSHNETDVLARGALQCDLPEWQGATFWRISFDEDRICRAEIMREGNRMTLPKFAA